MSTEELDKLTQMILSKDVEAIRLASNLIWNSDSLDVTLEDKNYFSHLLLNGNIDSIDSALQEIFKSQNEDENSII